MGRHSAPAPPEQREPSAGRLGQPEPQPSTLPVITVAMLRPAAPPAPAPDERARATSDHRQSIGLLERPEPTVAMPAPPRAAVQPPEAPPVRTAQLPRTEPVRLVPPDLHAHSLSTGPVPVHPRRTPRRPTRAVRIAVALAAIAIAGAVATQLTTQRSDADPAGLLLPSETSATASSSSAPATTAAGVAGSASATQPVSGALSTSSASAPSGTGSTGGSLPPTGSTGSPSGTTSASTGTAGSVLSSVGRSLRTALVGGRALTTGLFRFDDFGSDLLGMDLTGRLVGTGSASTVLEMAPMSSTKRAKVPTKAWTTNQLSLIRISRATVVSGFTLRGTDQGHLYNGLRISRSTNPRISDVRVVSIPGDDDIPPGETFGINDFRTSGAAYSNVEVDGSGLSGATFGTNDSNDVSILDSSFHDAGHSNGATFWQTRNVTVRNTTSVDNKDAAFNFERVSGTVVLDHVTMHGNGLSDLRIDSDKSSAVYRIVDPVLHGRKLTIVMTPRYMGHPNLQRKSDVHVIVNGVDRTADLVTWVDHF